MKVGPPLRSLRRRAVARAAARRRRRVGRDGAHARRLRAVPSAAEPRPAPRDRRRPRRAGRVSPTRRTPTTRAGCRPRCCTTSASSTAASACTGASWRRCRARRRAASTREAWSESTRLHPPGRPLPAPRRARRRPHPARRRARGGRALGGRPPRPVHLARPSRSRTTSSSRSTTPTTTSAASGNTTFKTFPPGRACRSPSLFRHEQE